jgi:acetylornithine deacetylase/succinyl-diaminopimelate desuccinylase-like protein
MKKIFPLLILLLATWSNAAPADEPTRQMARGIFKELIETNTTDSAGSVTNAANEMAKRLLDAGFPAADVVVVGDDMRKLNMVARYRGTGKKKPILWINHLDVVEARREDWSLDPFVLTEKDGYFYGRGTEDIKQGAALLVTTFIRFKKEGYKPDRDIILALTAGEEDGKSNGVEWLLKNRRDLIDAEFVLNPDAGSFELDKGTHVLVGLQASEKLYADFALEVHNKGGHSSQPTPDNAIYQLAAGLTRLSKYKFPFELNEVTRGYFEKQGPLTAGQDGADMKAILQSPPSEEAIVRLSSSPFYNSRYRTTCVATRLEAGHANNALPGYAKAIVNCRILPGHTALEVRDQLVAVVADPAISVTQLDISSGIASMAPNPPSPLTPDVVAPLERVVGQMWPGLPVVPFMDAGASDGAITRGFGMRTYGVVGVFIDINDDRSHGRDERLPVASFYEGIEFFYRFNKALTGGKP